MKPISVPTPDIIKLEAHPHSKLFPPMAADDFEKLVADIKANDLQQPIVLYQGCILDGNNRKRACLLAQRPPAFVEFDGTDAQAQAFVISANIHRRHLTADQKRDLLVKLIKADPTKSNRQHADTAKVSHVTVGDVRSELESTGQIDQLSATTGADGKTRKRKKKEKSEKKKKSDKETITYSEVVDAFTAYRAYQLFEQHLLDALQQLWEFSPVDHDVGEYARGTIEKLENSYSHQKKRRPKGRAV
jgi:ParB-like chromosome segregation protein Spo0J